MEWAGGGRSEEPEEGGEEAGPEGDQQRGRGESGAPRSGQQRARGRCEWGSAEESGRGRSKGKPRRRRGWKGEDERRGGEGQTEKAGRWRSR